MELPEPGSAFARWESCPADSGAKPPPLDWFRAGGTAPLAAALAVGHGDPGSEMRDEGSNLPPRLFFLGDFGSGEPAEAQLPAPTWLRNQAVCRLVIKHLNKFKSSFSFLLQNKHHLRWGFAPTAPRPGCLRGCRSLFSFELNSMKAGEGGRRQRGDICVTT